MLTAAGVSAVHFLTITYKFKGNTHDKSSEYSIKLNITPAGRLKRNYMKQCASCIKELLMFHDQHSLFESAQRKLRGTLLYSQCIGSSSPSQYNVPNN